jgi:NAD(P)-dependent dehydrogenase (short-subunit alcohol dehydrogenase family)
MRIILVGASGTLGRAIDAALVERHEIVRVARHSGDVNVDITDPAGIEHMFKAIGRFDALVCAAGHVHFAPLAEMSAEQYGMGLASKLMGQVNLVLAGRHFIADGGSFTLISGILDREPIRNGSSASMVNAAIDAFVAAAAIELPRGVRINSVSPTVFEESMPAYGPFFRGFKPVPVAEAALAFVRSVEGAQTGRCYRVGQ